MIQKFFLPQFFFYPQKIFFCPKKFFYPQKIFLPSKIFLPPKIFFTPKNFRPQNIFHINFICDIEKNMHKIRVFCSVIFANDPLCPSGILKIPRAIRRALGIFKIPSWHRGSRRRFPPKNPNLLYILLSNITMKNPSQPRIAFEMKTIYVELQT